MRICLSPIMALHLNDTLINNIPAWWVVLSIILFVIFIVVQYYECRRKNKIGPSICSIISSRFASLIVILLSRNDDWSATYNRLMCNHLPVARDQYCVLLLILLNNEGGLKIGAANERPCHWPYVSSLATRWWWTISKDLDYRTIVVQ